MAWTPLALIFSVLGFLIGGWLGFTTEHGYIGLVTVAAALLGGTAGVWVAQQMAANSDEP
jgi:uncharacterized protein YcfJ